MSHDLIQSWLNWLPDGSGLHLRCVLKVEDAEVILNRIRQTSLLELRLALDPAPTLPPEIQPIGATWADVQTKEFSFGVKVFGGSEAWTRAAFEVLPEIGINSQTLYPIQLNMAALRLSKDADQVCLHFAIPLPEKYRQQGFSATVEPIVIQGQDPVPIWQIASFKYDPDAILLPDPDPALEDLYVFISYARPDQAIAEQVESYLKAAGCRIFRDSSDIPSGGNWDMTIEQALDETSHMVLLMSDASMPYRKEVYREWFYYDQENKPLYPLYVKTAEKLHSRMRAYNYLDARTNLNTSLARLLADLQQPFKPASDLHPRDRIIFTEAAENRSLSEAMQALLQVVQSDKGSIALQPSIIDQIRESNPTDEVQYRLWRIAEWSQDRYQLDNRFVRLTLIIDKGTKAEGQRYEEDRSRTFDDLRTVMNEINNPAFVVLGDPGSGKSTLLRRLELDLAIDRLRDTSEQLTFFIQLNEYQPFNEGGALPSPREWLAYHWRDKNPDLPSFDELLNGRRLLLLLDALNEMPHSDADEYSRRLDLWQQFLREAIRDKPGNRAIFTCRTLDYSVGLSSDGFSLPQVRLQPMNDEQIKQFLAVYTPAHTEAIWEELAQSPQQLDLFRNPFFLQLLTDQVEGARGKLPQGRAALFTGFIRHALEREIQRRNPLFKPNGLLDADDVDCIIQDDWENAFELPSGGCLIPKLTDLAYTMQADGIGGESLQIRIKRQAAIAIIQHAQAREVLRGGLSLNILDEERRSVAFFHQLLQEFFAARQLAQNPDPALVHVEWAADAVQPSLAGTLKTLGDSDPLPLLAQTGWEETTLLAAAMTESPDDFLRGLMAVNLPLAGRAASAPELRVTDALKSAIQQALITRTQDMSADLRARIAAGLALGELGDPRFERRKGANGDYLMPPLVTIPAGDYPIGDDNSRYDDEKPAHSVPLTAFQIGQFPVTNAEYALFMATGGYEEERWWDMEEAKAWLRGEGSSEGSKQGWRDTRKLVESWTAEGLKGLVTQGRITSKQAEDWITVKSWSEEYFENWLDEQFPSGKIYREPEYWHDSRFSNPAQPVVGLSWFEARAYCQWLAAQTGIAFELPSEVQFEAAARGKEGRMYPYGSEFDVSKSNTFESHIRRTTPIGIYANATPEGAYDLSGNAYTWTTSIYDQDQFPYPYQSDDGRNDITISAARRGVRGGSWFIDQDSARAAYRDFDSPNGRFDLIGFRLCAPLL